MSIYEKEMEKYQHFDLNCGLFSNYWGYSGTIDLGKKGVSCLGNC